MKKISVAFIFIIQLMGCINVGTNGKPIITALAKIAPKGESVEYKNCTNTVRFTLYSPNFSGNSDQPGHQPPDFYLSEVPIWFNSF